MKYRQYELNAEDEEKAERAWRLRWTIQILAGMHYLVCGEVWERIQIHLIKVNQYDTWRDRFDYIYSKLLKDDKGLEKLDLLLNANAGSSDDNLGLDLLTKKLRSNILNEGILAFYDLYLLMKAIKICSNPVGVPLIAYRRCITVVKLAFALSGEMLPALGECLLRLFVDSGNEPSIDRLQTIVYLQEGVENLAVVDTLHLCSVFGHQWTYPHIAGHLSRLNEGLEHKCYLDPRRVANKALFKVQKESGLPIIETDITRPATEALRAWHVLIVVSHKHLLGFNKFPLDCDSSIYSREIQMMNKIQRGNNKKTKYRAPMRKEISGEVADFVSSSKGYVCISWRTNTFKGECTNYNDYRNSNPKAVVAAIKTFASNHDVDVVVVCATENDHKESLLQCSKIKMPVSFEMMSDADYLYLLANSRAFLTGCSGAQDCASMLYNKPTLVFDYPLFFAGDGYSKVEYDMGRMKLFENGVRINGDPRSLSKRIPRNGMTLSEMGISWTPLSEDELIKCFSDFWKVYRDVIASQDVPNCHD